jgi:hypothetical protein
MDSERRLVGAGQLLVGQNPVWAYWAGGRYIWQVRCPECSEWTHKEAALCMHCQANLGPESSG